MDGNRGFILCKEKRANQTVCNGAGDLFAVAGYIDRHGAEFGEDLNVAIFDQRLALPDYGSKQGMHVHNLVLQIKMPHQSVHRAFDVHDIAQHMKSAVQRQVSGLKGPPVLVQLMKTANHAGVVDLHAHGQERVFNRRENGGNIFIQIHHDPALHRAKQIRLLLGICLNPSNGQTTADQLAFVFHGCALLFLAAILQPPQSIGREKAFEVSVEAHQFSLKRGVAGQGVQILVAENHRRVVFHNKTNELFSNIRCHEVPPSACFG